MRFAMQVRWIESGMDVIIIIMFGEAVVEVATDNIIRRNEPGERTQRMGTSNRHFSMKNRNSARDRERGKSLVIMINNNLFLERLKIKLYFPIRAAAANLSLPAVCVV